MTSDSQQIIANNLAKWLRESGFSPELANFIEEYPRAAAQLDSRHWQEAAIKLRAGESIEEILGPELTHMFNSFDRAH